MILIEEPKPVATERYFEDLREFAVRDPSRILPGAELLFVHLSEISQSTSIPTYPSTVERVTVTELAEKTHRALRGLPDLEDDPSRRMLAVLYRNSDGEEDFRYAADAGMIPYRGYSELGLGGYSPWNFTVLISDLEERAIAPILELSKSRLKEIKSHNRRFQRGR